MVDQVVIAVMLGAVHTGPLFMLGIMHAALCKISAQSHEVRHQGACCDPACWWSKHNESMPFPNVQQTSAHTQVARMARLTRTWTACSISVYSSVCKCQFHSAGTKQRVQVRVYLGCLLQSDNVSGKDVEHALRACKKKPCNYVTCAELGPRGGCRVGHTWDGCGGAPAQAGRSSSRSGAGPLPLACSITHHIVW